MKFTIFHLHGTIESPPLPNRPLMAITLGDADLAHDAFVNKSGVVEYQKVCDVDANNLDEAVTLFDDVLCEGYNTRTIVPGDIVVNEDTKHFCTWLGWKTI